MSDMNAQLDNIKQDMEQALGPHGTSRMKNGNGERFLFCNTNGMSVGNTFFAHKSIHKKMWRASDGITKNEIDFICISQRWRSSIQDVRVYRGADIGSDHYLLKALVKLKLKKIKTSQSKRPFAVEKLKDPLTVNQFQISLINKFSALQNSNDIEDQWQNFSEAVRECAETSIDRRRGTHKEQWIQPETWVLIDRRKEIKIQREQIKSEQERQVTERKYQTVDRQVKKSCRKHKRLWLKSKAREAQDASCRNDTKTLYKMVKKLTGTENTSNIPVKDKHGKTLLAEGDQNARWIEHFKETLKQPIPISTVRFDNHPTIARIQANMEPITAEEVTKAIQAPKNSKAPGFDQIPPELLKCNCNGMIQKLVHLFNLCWTQEQVPEEWRKGLIVKLPKKGNISDCNNWRGVTLLSVPSKVFCAILLNRIKAATDKMLLEEQTGFRNGRSCPE